jgi:tetratricopeptide (TPR) repeat protein
VFNLTNKSNVRGFSCALLLLATLNLCGANAEQGPEADTHFQRALQYEFAENIPGAIAEYKRALEMDPNNVTGHGNYGMLLMNEVGDLDGAISEFVTTLGIDPQNAFAQTHLNEAVALRNSTVASNLDRANMFYRTGQLVRALAAYRVACYVDPKNAEAHNSLAWTLYRLGDLRGSQKEVDVALSLKPNDPEYINTLACVKFDSGDVNGAIKEFERAISLSKKANAADLYGLALGFLSQGQKDRAIESFKKALQNDPNYVDAKYLRDRIGMSVHALSMHEKLMSLSGVKDETSK